jgi:hypothetical protein
MQVLSFIQALPISQTSPDEELPGTGFVPLTFFNVFVAFQTGIKVDLA